MPPSLLIRDCGKNCSPLNLFFFILVTLSFSNSTFAESLPNSYFTYQSQKLLYDVGENWETLTIFGNQRLWNKNQKKIVKTSSAIQMDGQLNFKTRHSSYSIDGFGHLVYKNNYYAYTYPSLIKKINYNNSIRGEKFNIENEHDSGLGYESSWATLQIGKGKESWGSGPDIQLGMSNNSSSYDYFLLGSDYGKIRVRYIHGFLENIDSTINRYITARGFEWTNKKSLIVGFSEIVIYSGENRLMDIGYLNPLSSHLELELNNRLNTPGTSNSNGVWQLHLDYFFKKFRLSFNYLIDEFVLDKNIELRKEHGRAFSIRFAHTPIFNRKCFFSLHTSFVYVGTPTFRHKLGPNNFVQSDKPLGWYRGSDGQEFFIGINYSNNKNLIFTMYSGIYKTGQETITSRSYDPYKDYLEGSFPSGKVTKSFYFGTSLIYLFRENLSISSNLYQSEKLNIFELKVTVQLFRIIQ